MESLSEFCAQLALIGSAVWNLGSLLHGCHKRWLCNLSNGNHLNYGHLGILRLFLGRQYFLSAYPIDQMFSFSDILGLYFDDLLEILGVALSCQLGD